MPPEIVHAQQVAQLVDDLVGCVGRAFGGVGIREAAHVARELDGRPLEPVADAEKRDPPLPRASGRAHHAARAAIAEPAGHQDAHRRPSSSRGPSSCLQRLGIDPRDVDAQPMLEPAVGQRFVEALVGILQPDVLADDVNRDLVVGVADAIDQIVPLGPSALGRRQMQAFQDDLVEPFVGRPSGTS